MNATAADFTRLRIGWENGVTHLTLDRPEHRNTIDLTLAQELLRASLLPRTAASRCVLLSGTGEHFCAGGDLKEFREHNDLPGHLKDVTTHLHAALAQLTALPAPLVVAARGHVAGAGLGLACLADVLLSDEDVTYRAAYGAIGLTPDASTSHLLPALVGLRRAQRMTLLGHVLDAEQAECWGLSTETVSAGGLAERGVEIAERIAAGPTVAFGETNRLLRAAALRSLTEHLQDESATLSAVAGSSDATEGIAAFIGRRPAVFRGRV